MNKLSGILALLLLVGSTTLVAQGNNVRLDAQINWGEEYTEPSGSFLSKVVATQGEGFYALREKRVTGLTGELPNKIYLEYYHNRKMKMLKSREIDLRYKNKKRQLEEVMMLGGKLYLLTSFHNEAKKKNYLFTQRIDNRSLNLKKDLQMIGEIDTRGVLREGSFDYHISRDSQTILVINKLPNKKSEPERFALRVFDDNFTEQWQKDIHLPYDNQNFSIEEYRVDNAGNVYLLGILYNGNRASYKGRPNYQYIILSYPAAGAQPQQYKLQLRDQFITDLTFRIARNGRLVCSGFYSDVGTASVKGTYFLQIDPQTKEVFQQSLKAFDFDFLLDDYSASRQRRIRRAEAEGDLRNEPELYRYSLDDLILRSDGGVVLIAEQYYVDERSFRDIYTGVFNTNFYYNYNDIIVVNIRPSGEIEWATRIPKRQVSTNDGGYYSSYAMSIVRDKIYFVFNDNRRNYDERNHNNRLYNFNGSNSIIALAEVSKDGGLEVRPLFNNREASIITRPKVCKQTNKREMVIYGEKGRRYRFAHLEFGRTSRS
ncbi:MAG: hypothetical protein AAF146_16590 [Bacteroidota bacterium]